jgi:hypothetical protein
MHRSANEYHRKHHNCSNEQLVRTYHPSLSQGDGVYAVQDSDEKWIWVVVPGPDRTIMMTTYAGGRDIRLYPVGITEQTTTMWPRYQSDPRAALNPRTFFLQMPSHSTWNIPICGQREGFHDWLRRDPFQDSRGHRKVLAGGWI